MSQTGMEDFIQDYCNGGEIELNHTDTKDRRILRTEVS